MFSSSLPNCRSLRFFSIHPCSGSKVLLNYLQDCISDLLANISDFNLRPWEQNSLAKLTLTVFVLPVWPSVFLYTAQQWKWTTHPINQRCPISWLKIVLVEKEKTGCQLIYHPSSLWNLPLDWHTWQQVWDLVFALITVDAQSAVSATAKLWRAT